MDKASPLQDNNLKAKTNSDLKNFTAEGFVEANISVKLISFTAKF